jgi:hypothetical protein
VATDLANDPPVTPVVPLPSGVTYALNLADAATNTSSDMLKLHHSSSASLTPGVAGFGESIVFEGPKSDGTFDTQATISGEWHDPDVAFPYGRIRIYAHFGGTARKLAMEIKSEGVFLPPGTVANPGIAFNGSTTSGFTVDATAVRPVYVGASNFAMNNNGVSFCAVTVPVAAQSVLAALTNNIVASGSSTLADWTSLTVYATDAAAIHAAAYQTLKKLGAIETALRNFGLVVT